MKKLKVYLDTSIINFLKVEDSPDYRRDTEQKILIINKLNGYNYPFRMINPLEVLNYE